MTTKTTQQVLTDYQTILDLQKQLKDEYQAKITKTDAALFKIKSWLNENIGELEEVPEFLVLSDPQLAWELGQKTDSFAAKMHMTVDDEILPQLKTEYDQKRKPLEGLLEEIETWGLTQLLERKAKNFKTEYGTGSLRTDVKYQIADKRLFVAWATENNAESELTITLRPNSKFMGQVVENSGELPPGVSSFKEQKCTFIKAK